MNKVRLFVENFLIYGIGGVISKIVPLLMVPIVTRLMPNSSYYGISDLSNTIIQFGSAIAIMGMYDAMYRLFFDSDSEEYKKEVCSTALIFTIILSFIVFIVMIVFRDIIAIYAFGNYKYSNLVYITAIATLVGATNSIISAPTRMRNQRKVYLLMNTISPVLSYTISIMLLIKGYYLIALPISAVIAGFSCECIFYFLNRKWFKISKFNIQYLKPLLSIAIPLLPNFLIYWIFNSSDRLMIANFMGTSASGVYSVGAKLGQCSQLIYIAFAGGWQYFAFSTMNDKNQVKTNSMIFEYLGVISFVTTMLVCTFSKLIFGVLFTGEYISGYVIAPYLFLSPLLQMLFQIAANQFLVIKKTWPNLFILSLGAIINIILNLFLIPVIGIEGAAVATLIGYAISDILCIWVLYKMKLHILTKKFFFVCVIMLVFIMIWRLLLINSVGISLIMVIISTIIILLLYRKDIIKIKDTLIGKR